MEEKNKFGYSKKVVELFRNPKNLGELEEYDSVGKVGNPTCGDIMYVYIKVGKRDKGKNQEQYIKDISFQTMGCIAAIATSSMITEIAKGKTLQEAKKITNKDVASALGNLPPIKMHCSNLAADALKKAIENYEKNLKGGKKKNG
jgi:nitrogen fixation NifU-like protein